MKRSILAAALFLASSVSQAIVLPDGWTLSGLGLITSTAFDPSTGEYHLSTGETTIVVDATTPLQFKGTSKLTGPSDIKVGTSAVEVPICVFKAGLCYVTASVFAEFGYDPAQFEETITVYVGKEATKVVKKFAGGKL